MVKYIYLRVRRLEVVHHLHTVGHKLEHPAHLIYFALLAGGGSYKIAAVGCLVVGIAAVLPGGSNRNG